MIFDEDQSDNSQNVQLRQDMEKQLLAYEEFAKGPGGEHFRRMREIELLSKKSDIISCDPIDRSGEIESYKMRGDLRTTEEFLTVFEDTITRLKDRIAQLSETEQPSGEQQETIE